MDWLSRQLLEELDELRAARRLRSLPDLEGVGVRRHVAGQDVLVFCSNDYLGLATEPALAKASAEVALSLGTGAGGARLISGNGALYAALEQELAAWCGCEAALCFSAGYLANMGVLTVLAGPDDVIASDAMNHASIIDGCRLSRAQVRVYPHGDVAALAGMLRAASSARRRLVVTESLFSMDGDIAPLAAILDVARQHEAIVVVDEAHALGVYGPQGGGVLQALGLAGQVDAVVGTMGKAMGSAGAFVAGSQPLIDVLVNKARSFIFNTGLPPGVLAASLAALGVLRVDGALRREQLLDHARRLRHGLGELGFTVGGESYILPVVLGDNQLALAWRDALLEEGLFVQAIRPPTVPAGTSRLRLTVSSAHTSADIDAALEVFARVQRRLGIVRAIPMLPP
jgi:8-amino-7-oxononanoate synthase